jgi:beta-galactosidase
VRVEDAEVLATFAADLTAGGPALTRRRVGAGRALYLAAGLDVPGWDALAAFLVAEAGVAPVLAAPSEVEISERISADGTRHLFVLNHRHTPVSVPLGAHRGVDVLTGRRATRTLTLAPLGAAVIAITPGGASDKKQGR